MFLSNFVPQFVQKAGFLGFLEIFIKINIIKAAISKAATYMKIPVDL